MLDDFAIDDYNVLKFYRGSNSVVNIPEGVKYIDDDAFYGNTYVGDVTIPNGVTYVGHGAFRGCTSLKNIIIPESVTYIGDLAFEKCTSLENINIPKSVTHIGNDAFYDTPFLENYPKDFVILGDNILCHCKTKCYEKEINIPQGVTKISPFVFSNSWNLERVIIPSSVIVIGYACFLACKKLEIEVPKTVKTICPSAFTSCKKVTYLD